MATASAAGTNLIGNPSVETATGSAPTGWTPDKWGTNTTALSYKTDGGHTGTKSLYVSMTKWTDGDARWDFTPVAVKPNQKYTYTDYYKSNVTTGLEIRYTDASGKQTYTPTYSAAASPTAWQAKTVTFTTPANVAVVLVYHYIQKVGWLQTDDVSLVEGDGTAPTAPTVLITAPAPNATVAGTQAITATASDAVGVSGVQFKLDGTNIGAEDTTAPYSASLDTMTLTNGVHTITATARNASNLTTVATETINVQNLLGPTVSFTAPLEGSTVSGTAQQVTATVSDPLSVSSVQFKLDGNNLGAPVTAAPYAITWDTTTATNGVHVLTAIATSPLSLTPTAVSVSVTVNNAVVVPPTAPSVAITAPAANATVTGTQAITANASDAVGVSGVQFKVDGTNIGVEDTTAPYSASLDTKTLTNAVHTITATARNASNLTTVASETINVQNATAPTVSITAPAANATVTGTQAITANASDAVGVSGVQFKVDGTNIGAEDTTAPYSASLDTKTLTNAVHTITATARNASNLTTVASETINVQNATAPTVSVTGPADGSTVSGTAQQITATASDTFGVSSVQFKLDGNNLGAPVTTAPYAITWDTTTATNGVHVLSAVATNLSHLTATAANVSVTVNNAVVTPPSSTNLIANPSLETVNGTGPQGWQSSSWGTNTTAFSYLNTGHTGTRSAKVQMSRYTNGAANWYYAPVPVTAGKTYKYENWYQSDVDTEVDAEIVMNDGSIQYAWLGSAFADTTWAKFSTTFTAPAGAKSVVIYQTIFKAGYLATDDYSLSEYTSVPFSRGLVSVTFDDGFANQYTNAVPLMKKYAMLGTYYIISGSLTAQPDYMTGSQVKSLYTDGNEIGSHSVTHPDLTTATQSNLVAEMAQSQATLQGLLGAPVTDFAYPYGAYNSNTVAVGQQYYESQRTVDDGLNTKDNFDPARLKIHEVDNDISQAQVKAWVDAAVAQHAWLILVYHQIVSAPPDPADARYTTAPADLDAELSYIQSSGVATATVHQALDQLLTQ